MKYTIEFINTTNPETIDDVHRHTYSDGIMYLWGYPERGKEPLIKSFIISNMKSFRIEGEA